MDSVVSGSEIQLEQWQTRIAAAWRKTVGSVIEVGQLVAQAKEELGASYTELASRLPFSAPVAAFLIKIAGHPVLSNSDYWDRLPNSYNTLYYLAGIDEARLIRLINDKEVTPETTGYEAKALCADAAVSTKKEAGNGLEKTDSGVQIPVILAIPELQEPATFFKELEKFLKKFKGTVSDPGKDGPVVEWRREAALQQAEAEIEDFKARLARVNLEQLRMLEAAAEYLSSSEQPISCLPDDYESLDSLADLLGEREITKKVLRKWCKSEKVPSRLALQDVAQEVYVWEQVRLVASGEDDKGGAKRLKKIAEKNRHTSIQELAKEALSIIESFNR